MSYIEGFVAAVPKQNREAYRKHVEEAAPLFKELGALRMVEAWGEDIPDGKLTDFRKAVQAKPDESVVFSWLEYADRAACDAADKKMMSDERMKQMAKTMPFDGHRMIYGGFTPLVEEGQGKGNYVDGMIVPVPEKNRDAYRAQAAKTAEVIKEHGALRVVEAWGDDLAHGKTTDFYRATQANEGEKVVFSFITWPDKATRDAAWPRIMKDPRMQPAENDACDGKRMFWGGFEPLIDA